MIRQKRLSSVQQAAKSNRLQTIAIAAQRAEFKAQGGTVEKLGVTESHNFSVARQHSMMVMNG